ncbi:TetR/AcrR family transcriptional regulator [Acinetobacter seifertii]|uniref:TetR/AcrR family transcriptional regulator n=1 Tax=Acinetobacter seifertii TaxID=1530123 RepID=UPI0012507FBE|nr:TetR/AcrR family transcriptional regulator [Acinetobacter seifertii]
MEKTYIDASRRGRPPRTEDQLEASRNSIIQAARDLFAIHGYEGVSMRKIAVKANCLPSTLYLLFPSKNELLHKILEVIYKDLNIQLEQCYRSSYEPDRLQNLCLILLEFWLDRPGDCKAIFLIEDNHFESKEDSYLNKLEIFQLNIYNQTIIEAQLRGEIKDGDPEEIKNILLFTIFGIALSLISISKYHFKNEKKIREKIVKSLINGIK